MDQHGSFTGNALARECGSRGLPGVGPPGTSFAPPFSLDSRQQASPRHVQIR